MALSYIRNSMEWALLVALVFGAGAIAQAEDKETKGDGRIIQINPATSNEPAISSEIGNDTSTTNTPGVRQQPAAPQYWIGLLGEAVPEDLRAHIDLPDGQGVLAREVIPDSPAAKAGLKKFDILLRANDADLHEMRDLAELVRTEGDRGGKITVEVLHHGQRETVWVTPETRPEHAAQPGFGAGPGQGWGGGGAPPVEPNDMMQFFKERLGRGGNPQGPFAFRMFGPGAIVGGQSFSVAQLPNGVSVSIQKQNDQPAHITVRRGDQSWEVVGDDPESLKALPDDLRPFVEQMLGGGGNTLQALNMPTLPAMPGMPSQPAMPNMPVPPNAGPDLQRMQQQMQAMEQQMRDLEQRLQGLDKTQPNATQ